MPQRPIPVPSCGKNLTLLQSLTDHIWQSSPVHCFSFLACVKWGQRQQNSVWTDVFYYEAKMFRNLLSLCTYDQNLSRHHSSAEWILAQYMSKIVTDVTSRLSYWEFLLRKTFDKLTYLNFRRNRENFRARSFIAVTPGNRYSWTVTSLLRTHSITGYFSSFNSLTTGHRTLFIR